MVLNHFPYGTVVHGNERGCVKSWGPI